MCLEVEYGGRASQASWLAFETKVELAVMTDITQDVDEQANKCNTGLGENNSN
jgi:hypothetical protein